MAEALKPPVVVATFLAAGLTGGAPASQPAAAPAHTIVVNAKVVAVDAASTVAEAVAIRDGRFVAIGTNQEVRRLAGASTRLIDAGGRTVVPGLIDSHVHALGVAATEMRQPFANLESIAEVQRWVRTRAAETREGEWIWSPRVFPTRVHERRFPTRAELDAAAPRHPVVVDGAYALMLNSAALEAASIDRNTPNPPGGAIVKDATGEPTGLLRNVGGMLDRFHRGADGGAPSLDALARVHAAYNRVGITSIGERASSVAGFHLYEALRKAGRLRVRATVTIQIPDPRSRERLDAFFRGLALQPRQGDDWLKVGPLKIFADGGILAGTAYMREPYGPKASELYGIDDPAYRGLLTLTREQIAAAVDAGASRGWQMAAHVTGDAGVDAVLDAFESAQTRHPSADPRHTLIHAYFANAEAARRAARLGVVVDTQPAWYYKDADALAAALGEPRLERFIGVKTWLDAGVTTAINTDHMFGVDPDTSLNPFNPFLTMATAITRRSEGGRVIGQGERISRMEALRLMTASAARLSFDEGNRGSIEVGKLADLAILSDNLLTCADDRIAAITVDLTVVGGEIVYDSGRVGRVMARLSRTPDR